MLLELASHWFELHFYHLLVVMWLEFSPSHFLSLCRLKIIIRNTGGFGPVVVIHHTVVTIIRPDGAVGFIFLIHLLIHSTSFFLFVCLFLFFYTLYVSGPVWVAGIESVSESNTCVLLVLKIQEAIETWDKCNEKSNCLVFGDPYEILSEQAVVSLFATFFLILVKYSWFPMLW